MSDGCADADRHRTGRAAAGAAGEAKTATLSDDVHEFAVGRAGKRVPQDPLGIIN